MNRVGRSRWLVAVGLLAAAACSDGTGVETEARRTIPTVAPSTVPSGGSAPAPPSTTTTTTTEPAGTPELLSVTFELGEVRVDVGLAPTTAPRPPGGVDGFRSVVELDDGTLLASGADAGGDGVTLENGALWRSDDATTWTRVGVELSAPAGLQEIVGITADGSGARAFGVEVALDDPRPRIDSLVEWRPNASDEWESVASLAETSVRQARTLQGMAVTVGAANWNTPGANQGVVIWHGAEGGAVRTAFVDAGADGEPIPGSEVYTVAIDQVEPARWVAVGHTTITDSARAGDEHLADIAGGFPSDTGVWWSNDSGATWRLDDTSRFADVPGAQGAVGIEQVGGQWWMLVGEEDVGASFARRLYRSVDGALWSLDDYRRPEPLTETDLPGARGLWTVDELVVIVDEVNGAEGPSLVMTMIDPTTGATDQHDLTLALGGLHQVNEVIELSDGSTGLGFGRIERGPDQSDLQVIEIRRSDPPPPEPEPEEPLPSTTAPASSGGSSNA